MAKSLQNGLQAAVEIMAEWQGISSEPEVDMNTSHDLIIADADEIAALQADRERGDLSRESYWLEMTRRGIYREDFDPEAEVVRLRAEDNPL